MNGFALAILAGICASLASVSSKLALEEGGKTLRHVVPCAWMTELQCFYVRIRNLIGELHPLIRINVLYRSW